MRLSLETREVGRVTIVRCNGRIVAGSESESLRSHVTWLLRDRRAIVLHLGEVGFIDSSGLGTIVRSLTSTRQVHGDLKLCNVPEHVRKVLELSQLTKLFDAHESEENAVAAFYHRGAKAETPVSTGRSVLCLDGNADVLACLRELLHRTGHHVHTCSRLGDALILMRVSHFDLVLIGPELTSFAATHPGFQAACAKVPMIELGSDFSSRDAGEACAGLLEKIQARLNPTIA
ncbi:MAG TPA: anti-sigma factor antagonist [Terriglobales bacterium]|jgi:anti-sigma B factor antagonist|nr:anti-sigma factor antagonist [Terriglobales bacterium]